MREVFMEMRGKIGVMKEAEGSPYVFFDDAYKDTDGNYNYHKAVVRLESGLLIEIYNKDKSTRLFRGRLEFVESTVGRDTYLVQSGFKPGAWRRFFMEGLPAHLILER
jgi:hypothetical protein